MVGMVYGIGAAGIDFEDIKHKKAATTEVMNILGKVSVEALSMRRWLDEVDGEAPSCMHQFTVFSQRLALEEAQLSLPALGAEKSRSSRPLRSRSKSAGARRMRFGTSSKFLFGKCGGLIFFTALFFTPLCKSLI